MGKREKKTAKGRLDKYYRLAKEQGYRARSAFKLIQLNKRYQFLESARCCIDLCAAPGGWLQVAAKWMPANSLILGVDLVPIKPIPKVVTATEDIRTDSCRRWLRSELKDWKADVVLHDGAPNVGTAWVQDAFSQAELVLHSFKLATEMLAPGGTFVTKVFRSKDYNSLLYVFNQLFKKVESTKPPSSRNVSAEIFVVCQNFLAPKKIDPRLLDPAHVFKDLDSVPVAADGDTEGHSNKLTPNAQNVFKPEKKKRAREGYQDGDYILHTTVPVTELIKANDPIKILGVANTITFGKTDEDKMILKMKCTSKAILTDLQDLKVLGKGDFKKILKWRLAVREILGLTVKKDPEEAVPQDAVEVQPLDEDEEMEQELQRIREENGLQKKRERRRLNEKRTRDLQRMQLQMTAPMDIGLERADDEVFGLEEIDQDDFGSDHDQEGFEHEEIDEEESEFSDQSDDEDLSEEEKKLQILEASVGVAYDQYQEKILNRDTKRKVREDARLRRHHDEGEQEWTGLNEDDLDGGSVHSGDDIETVRKKRARFVKTSRSDDDEDSDSEGEDVTDQAARIMAERGSSSKASTSKPKQRLLTDLSEKTNYSSEVKNQATEMWFDQPVFKDVKGLHGQLNFDDDDDDEQDEYDDDDDDEDDEDVEARSASSDESADEETAQLDESDDDFEIVPQEPVKPTVWDAEDSDQDEKNARIVQQKGLLTPAAMQLALDLVNRRKTKDQLVDSGFRRDAFFDEKDQLPPWFLDDEMRHFREHVPVTKEAVKILRDKMRALDARPIKKVAEAKGRKKLRTLRRIEKMQNKANLLNANNDLTEKEKSGEIEKLMNRMSKNPKQKNEVKVVVAKGLNRGQKGRPKGVKGRYKMVDPRGRKELRAKKRKERESKKKRT
ncbi:Spb1 C-terminal domain-containing protein [Melampsora americana]|nr:Spb1 C-terminal domain-containing protein [Melampsora americana]